MRGGVGVGEGEGVFFVTWVEQRVALLSKPAPHCRPFPLPSAWAAKNGEEKKQHTQKSKQTSFVVTNGHLSVQHFSS